MRRRDFIGITVAGATCWPRMMHAQQKLPIVGILSATAPGTDGVNMFKRSLNEMGYVEGVNVKLEARWASGRAVSQVRQRRAHAHSVVAASS